MPAKKNTKTLNDLILSQGKPQDDSLIEPPKKSFPGGRETLLNTEDRKELPEEPTGPGRKCTLIEMVKYSPDLYAQLIMYIQQGAFYHVAAEAIGISTDSLRIWLKRGRADLLSLKDTWYSRLLLDIRRAVAIARVGAEVSIAETDSRRWLNMGPGRMFGDQWLDSQKEGDGQNPDQEDEAALIGEVIVSTHAIEDKSKEDEHESNTVVLRIDPAEELARIEAMEQSGLASYTEAHKDAIRRQIQQTSKKD
jgi:hypothetical protein